ncbi:hypothetical protein NIES37_58530 [Tolypothrix tenuis PCC 7101]|uniref:Uncharacterized protein n=1 Tax=Tolypothrix tenuis PCC 7101 TaxID=231146 RepID=A0A1Z4N7Z9_9CYAN|nr:MULTISPECIES: hypothetical protein [unclassified Tolypothrix]MBD2241945.1 hypothetical protein [Aulosira sp. FACHB-113]BAY92019.1 hypothetical protein NIES3275_40500 [Microchaete diplosiphon NIES-3275]BAZ01846.1 hypothetical protein NIES37_58530 [Tolypothrix tenuis PCC 7101]BAZ74229.1 hypothetical protein NIES50_28000 [Aulosira laxa NIES-50]EKF04785.1 hypothetical protein FDUTEX481_00943 [Tolypothrix sp. PCC 7601]
MGRPKRTSVILEKAQRRIAGLKTIDGSLDLGNGLTVEIFLELIEDTRRKLEAHNIALSAADQTGTLVSQAERSLADLSERMLTGVASKYGKRSDEYEMAGGARKRTGKRNARKVSTSTPTESPATI